MSPRHLKSFAPMIVVRCMAHFGLAAASLGDDLFAATPPAEPDTGFRAELTEGLNVSSIRSFALDGDGKVLIAGSLKGGADLPNQGIARLLVDGRFDPLFRPAADSAWVAAVAALRDGRILMVGSFRISDGVTVRTNFARLHANGSLDASFDAELWAAGAATSSAHLLELSDGKVLFAGSSVGGSRLRSAIVRLHEDGRLDDDYAKTPLEGTVRELAKGVDDEVYVMGTFFKPSFPARPTVLLRLRGDGSVDPSFPQPDFWVGNTALASTSDGGVILSSITATGPTGEVEMELIRLRRDGTRDLEYRPTVSG
ncbi:MAG: delta-60 repeat domain-containing protein, partial [Limisphaerales bacterium]